MVRVSLTPRGRKKIEALFPRFNAEESAVTSDLTPDEQDSMAEMLRSMLKTAEGV